MAKKIPDLIADERKGTGKGAARQARRAGLVPGVVYGGGIDPVADHDPIQQAVQDAQSRVVLWRLCST